MSSAQPRQTLKLLKQLVDTRVPAADIHAVLQIWNAAGKTGVEFQAKLSTLWTGFKVADAKDITEPAGPDPVKRPAGTRVLTGPMLVTQLKSVLKPEASSVASVDQRVKNYPTGQDPRSVQDINVLWKHCALSFKLDGETPEQAPVRQRLAFQELLTRVNQKDIARQIFKCNDGNAPRALKGVGAEDALGTGTGAHTLDRHVLDGKGLIKNVDDLALRVLGHRKKEGWTDTPTASAFNTLKAAEDGMKAALTGFAQNARQLGVAAPVPGQRRAERHDQAGRSDRRRIADDRHRGAGGCASAVLGSRRQRCAPAPQRPGLQTAVDQGGHVAVPGAPDRSAARDPRHGADERGAAIDPRERRRRFHRQQRLADMMERDAALERFGELLTSIVSDNTEDEAVALWRHLATLSPANARADLEALDAVLADPPGNLTERMTARGIRLTRVGETEVVPYEEAERLEWLRVLAERLRARTALKRSGAGIEPTHRRATTAHRF